MHSGETYNCEICGESFTYKRGVTLHKAVHFEKKFECKECNKVLGSEQSLDSHTKRWHNEELKCSPSCGKSFKTKNLLLIHQEKFHREVYICDICQKSCKNRQTLLIHQRIHMPKTLQCDECPKLFKTHGQVNVHKKNYHPKEPVICPDCGKSFNSRAVLDSHKRFIHRLGRVKCDICGLDLSSEVIKKHILQVHERAESQEVYSRKL